MAIQESTQTVSSGWKYTAAVRIQESDLDNLEKILKRYCDQVSYEVIYKNHSTKCCNSIGEITSGNNFLDNRVLSLNICCYQGTDEIISLFIGEYLTELWIGGIKYGILCQYKLKEKVGYEFTKEIIRFLKGIRESYSPFTKLSFKNLLLYIMTPLGILELICNYLFKVNLNSISWIKTGRSYLAEILQKSAFAYYGASLGVLLLLFLDLCVINPAFLRNFFPPICFAWGKELEHYEVVKKRREHLWWSVIVTLVLSIIAGVIVEIIINH